MSSSKLILGYWPIHGLASSIRLILNFVGEDFIEETFDNSSAWFDDKKHKLNLIYPNLPYLIDNNVRLTEHQAILRYLARKYDLIAKTEQEIQISDQSESFIFDIRRNFYKVVFNKDAYEKLKSVFIENTIKKLSYLNNLLADRNFITGSKLTYVDIYCFDLLLLLKAFEPSLIEKNPNLINFIDKISKLPSMAEYLNSPRSKELPFCSPSSNWNEIKKM